MPKTRELTADDRNLISRNAKQVGQYVEVLRPTLERSGQLPTEPLGKKHRGSSNPPISENLHDLIEANATEIHLMEPLLAKAMKSTAPVRAYRKDLMLLEVWDSPGSQLRWPAARQRAFKAMCELISYRLWSEKPKAELWVVTSGRMAQVKLGKREPEDEDGILDAKDAPAKTMREHSENVTKARTRRKLQAIYRAWAGIKRERNVGSEEAKRIMEQERGIARRTTERAITQESGGQGDAA